MYTVKKGTLRDVEDIWKIIEQTWAGNGADEMQRATFYLTHSIKKIEYEMIGNHQHYLMLMKDGMVVAFASYSFSPSRPPDYRIQKIYHGEPALDYVPVLLEHIRGVAAERGSRHLFIRLASDDQRKVYEKMGFQSSQAKEQYIGKSGNMEMYRDL